MGPSNDFDSELDPDPLNLFPGIPTTRAGPFGVPIPTPLAGLGSEPGGEQVTPEGDQSPSTTDDLGESDSGSLDNLRQAVESGEDYIDRVEEAMDEETCELCKQILDTLRTRPLEEQVQGVKELAELKQAAQRGADPVEIAEVMEDFEVVDDPSEMM